MRLSYVPHLSLEPIAATTEAQRAFSMLFSTKSALFTPTQIGNVVQCIYTFTFVVQLTRNRRLRFPIDYEMVRFGCDAVRPINIRDGEGPQSSRVRAQ